MKRPVSLPQHRARRRLKSSRNHGGVPRPTVWEARLRQRRDCGKDRKASGLPENNVALLLPLYYAPMMPHHHCPPSLSWSATNPWEHLRRPADFH